MARWNTEIIQQWLDVADVTHWTAREGKAQKRAKGIVERIDFSGQATTTVA
ncbi:hypothetical protein D3C76_398160 [compost metagenome]